MPSLQPSAFSFELDTSDNCRLDAKLFAAIPESASQPATQLHKGRASASKQIAKRASAAGQARSRQGYAGGNEVAGGMRWKDTEVRWEALPSTAAQCTPEPCCCRCGCPQATNLLSASVRISLTWPLRFFWALTNLFLLRTRGFRTSFLRDGVRPLFFFIDHVMARLSPVTPKRPSSSGLSGILARSTTQRRRRKTTISTRRKSGG